MAAGRVTPFEARLFAAVLAVLGLLELALGTNLAAAAVALATLVGYAVVYTPLKRRTPWATLVGAVPGALPPVIGWTAARGAATVEAWVLFGIVFLWQMPHFHALSWLYRDDFRRAGLPFLAVLDASGRQASAQGLLCAAALLPMSLAAGLVGLGGPLYLAAAALLGLAFIAAAARFALHRSASRARAVFLGVAGLPAAIVGPAGRRARLVAAPPGDREAMDTTDLPTLNALLNATSGLLLSAGYVMIRRGRIEAHRRCMLAACTASALFLISYVIYHLNVGSVPYTGQGGARVFYFAVLISHIILAAVIGPLAIVTLDACAARTVRPPPPHRPLDPAALALRLGHRPHRVRDALPAVGAHAEPARAAPGPVSTGGTVRGARATPARQPPRTRRWRRGPRRP